MEILWYPRATEDVEELWNYIAADNPAAADAVRNQIRSAVRSLVAHPNIGRPGRVMGTRELVLPRAPYVIPYRVRGDAVEIIRVLHAARKWPETFGD